MSSNAPPRSLNRPVSAKAGAPRRLCSTQLFDGATEIVIEHQGADYRLRVTRQGKLILTK